MTPVAGTAALQLYDQLLASIGGRAREIEPRLCVSHWPHVGSAYDGLLIVGQALRGWPNEWRASEAATEAGRRRILEVTRTHAASRPEPLDWIPDMKKVRNSPF